MYISKDIAETKTIEVNEDCGDYLSLAEVIKNTIKTTDVRKIKNGGKFPEEQAKIEEAIEEIKKDLAPMGIEINRVLNWFWFGDVFGCEKIHYFNKIMDKYGGANFASGKKCYCWHDDSIERRLKEQRNEQQDEKINQKLLKERQKKELNVKHCEYYDRVNALVDYANENREILFVRDSREQLDNLMVRLYDRTVNSIKKIKSIDSEEWDVIDKFITYHEEKVEEIVGLNQRILAYYRSSDFIRIKNTCEALMGSQIFF